MINPHATWMGVVGGFGIAIGLTLLLGHDVPEPVMLAFVGVLIGSMVAEFSLRRT